MKAAGLACLSKIRTSYSGMEVSQTVCGPDSKALLNESPVPQIGPRIPVFRTLDPNWGSSNFVDPSWKLLGTILVFRKSDGPEFVPWERREEERCQAMTFGC